MVKGPVHLVPAITHSGLLLAIGSGVYLRIKTRGQREHFPRRAGSAGHVSISVRLRSAWSAEIATPVAALAVDSHARRPPRFEVLIRSGHRNSPDLRE